MSINLRRGDENILDISAWISQSEAARLRGVTRAAISALVKRNRFKTLKIGGKNLLNRTDIEDYQPQPRGPKPKRRHKEVESTPPPDRRQSTTPQGRTRIQSPAQQNKYLINKRV